MACICQKIIGLLEFGSGAFPALIAPRSLTAFDIPADWNSVPSRAALLTRGFSCAISVSCT